MGFALASNINGTGNPPNVQKHSLNAISVADGTDAFILNETFTKTASDSFLRLKILPSGVDVGASVKGPSLTKTTASGTAAVCDIRAMKGTNFVSDVLSRININMNQGYNSSEVLYYNSIELNIYDAEPAGPLNIRLHVDCSNLNANFFASELVIEEVFVS